MNDTREAIEAVCRRLRVEPFWVGGTVRDHVLNRPSHDGDLVCQQAHRAARGVARRLSATLITLDEQHRIYRVILGDKSTLDFAELQGPSLEQDLARQESTINAMAAPLRFERIIDPFHGQNDLKKKVLRALSRKAFQEDPLRLLRAYRMMAQFDLTFSAQTKVWVKAEHHRLGTSQVARERVREELLRLLSQTQTTAALESMDRLGLLTVIFPELEAGRHVGLNYYGKGGVVKHHLQSVANVEWLLDRIESANPSQGLRFIRTPEILNKIREYVRQPVGGVPRAAFLKLAALLHDVGKPATAQRIKGRLRFFGHEDVGAQMLQKSLGVLRFSRQEGHIIRLWVRNHMRAGSLASAPRLTDKAMSRFFYDLGEDGVGMLLVSLGDHYTYLTRSKWGKGTDPVEQTAGRLLEAYYVKRDTVLPPKVVDGHFLMKKLHLKPGPMIGKLLNAVRDGQAEGKVKTADEALSWARKKWKGKALL